MLKSLYYSGFQIGFFFFNEFLFCYFYARFCVSIFNFCFYGYYSSLTLFFPSFPVLYNFVADSFGMEL